jgi:hypothetical protein
MAGYSSTPLLKKLGIKEENRVLLRNVPAALPEELKGYAKSRLKDRLDVLILFARSSAEFKTEFDAHRKSISTDGMIWVAWPKKASGMQTDLTENVIRETALKTPFVDVKVCAIDEVWSGLKLVIRKEHRKAFVLRTE